MEDVSEGVTTEKIQELKDLMIRRPIDRKMGPIGEKILKLLGYGDQQMSETKIKIAK